METNELEPNLTKTDSQEETTNLLAAYLLEGKSWEDSGVSPSEADGENAVPAADTVRRYHLTGDSSGALREKAEREDIRIIVAKYPAGFPEDSSLNFLDLAAEQYQLRTGVSREEQEAEVKRQRTEEWIRRLAAEEEGQRRAAEAAERRRRIAAARELQNRLDNGEHISLMNRALSACEKGEWQEALQYAYKSRALKPMLGTEFVLAVASSYTGSDTAYGFVMNCVENNFRAAEAQLAYYMNRNYQEVDPVTVLQAAQAAETDGANLLARHKAEYLALLAAYGNTPEDRQRGRDEFLSAFNAEDSMPNHTLLKIANWLYDGEEYPLAEHVYAAVNVGKLERGYQTANYYWRFAISEHRNNEHQWIQAHLKNCFYAGMLMEDAKFYSHDELETGVYQAVETPGIFWDFLDPETTEFAKAYFDDRRIFLTGGMTASEFYRRHVPDFMDRYVPHDYYYVQGPEGYRMSYDINEFAPSHSKLSMLWKRLFKK